MTSCGSSGPPTLRCGWCTQRPPVRTPIRSAAAVAHDVAPSPPAARWQGTSTAKAAKCERVVKELESLYNEIEVCKHNSRRSARSLQTEDAPQTRPPPPPSKRALQAEKGKMDAGGRHSLYQVTRALVDAMNKAFEAHDACA